MPRRSWAPIIAAAKVLVNSYTYLITLRQLHYLLVSTAQKWGYRNNDDDYGRLSELTAAARREGTFPDLIDQTRQIYVADAWDSPKDAVGWLADYYRRDRTEGQEHYLVLGGEKASLLAQLDGWFGDLGVPIVLLRGYGSQSYIDQVALRVERAKRERNVPAVLIYAGDLDASGYDILRDFTDRCPVFDKTEHIAVAPNHVLAAPRGYGLPINQGKGSDSRAVAFRRQFPVLARYADRQVASGNWSAQHDKKGVLLPNVVQIEAEALRPDDLRALYQAAIDTYWDDSPYQAALTQEGADQNRLKGAARRMR